MVRFNVPCELPFSRQDFWRIRASPSFLSFITRDGLLQSVHASPSEPAPAPAPPGTFTRRLGYVPARVDCPAVVRAVVGDTLFGVEDEQTWNDDVPEDHPDRFVQRFFIRPTFLKGISRTWGELRLEEVAEDEDEGDAGVDANAGVDAAGGKRVEVEKDGEDELSGNGELARECSSDGSVVSSETEEADAEEGAPPVKPSKGESRTEDPEDDSRDAVMRWEKLPSSQRCRHTVVGEARVSILTVGWFVERSIAHNLRLFYADYPGTVARFRSWLVDRFADGDDCVPMEHVLDTFLRWEAEREDTDEKTEDEEAEEGDVGEAEKIVDAVSEDDDDDEDVGGKVVGKDREEGKDGQRSSSRGRTHGMQFETLTPQPSVELHLSELA